jgi:alkylation response protein AidB-like acyl-CoA dehydrogenase
MEGTSMERCLTEHESSVVALADRLSRSFAERAGAHDRDATFPFENYDEMRAAGFLGLTVPSELGGMGAGLYEMCLALERLAGGCASTALAVTMHVSPLLQLSSLWRAEPSLSGVEQVLRDAANGSVIFASMSAEPGPSTLMTSLTRAMPVEGGYRVTGKKIFGTESAVCTHFSTMAKVEDPRNGDRVIFFRLPRTAPGLVFHDTWDTLGMRATQSNDWEMREVFVPADAVFHSYPVGHLDARMLQTVWGMAMPAFGSVYLGIAGAALEWVREWAVTRKRLHHPGVQSRLAQMEMLQETARAVIRSHCVDMLAGELAKLDVQMGMAKAGTVKYVATNHAVQIVDLAMQIAGGPGFYRRAPLERWYRDVRAGTIHPLNNLDAEELVGKTALRIEVAPAIPLAESGHGSLPRGRRAGIGESSHTLAASGWTIS